MTAFDEWYERGYEHSTLESASMLDERYHHWIDKRSWFDPANWQWYNMGWQDAKGDLELGFRP